MINILKTSHPPRGAATQLNFTEICGLFDARLPWRNNSLTLALFRNPNSRPEPRNNQFGSAFSNGVLWLRSDETHRRICGIWKKPIRERQRPTAGCVSRFRSDASNKPREKQIPRSWRAAPSKLSWRNKYPEVIWKSVGTAGYGLPSSKLASSPNKRSLRNRSRCFGFGRLWPWKFGKANFHVRPWSGRTKQSVWLESIPPHR